MNKKIIVLLLVVFCLASTIIISVFGKLPEDSSIISVNAIMFVDTSKEDGMCEVNEEGYKVISLEKGTVEYQLEWLINPSEATDQSVSFQIVNGQENATISETGLISFLYNIEDESEFWAPITVKIYSNPLDFKTDVVIVNFVGKQGSVVGPDDNPFDW